MRTHLQTNADEHEEIRREVGARKEQIALLAQQQQAIVEAVEALHSSFGFVSTARDCELIISG
eukprot:CAMPEP_0183372478 /NCGR_PEP_ID=MMETSP0164_2-20130417/108563_1 /TAXON_ID=221442 /ORGANISM="Coccolithus pelagicus ssp braarudi, Strain PLY182g" /LENGTH=62 /DNA_ID=CAMNT_0025549185 /DNA_START=1 /DNA_END=189 /DNA_ORIENTATION=-